MIIFFKRNAFDSTTAAARSIVGSGAVSGSPTSQPVVLLDDTRTDDKFSQTEILAIVQAQAAELGLTIGAYVPIFSLAYSVTYRHSAINLANALKTQAHVRVHNASTEFISLVQVQQIVGQPSLAGLQTALGMVVDPKNYFARAVMVFKVQNALGITENLVRRFIVYGTEYNFDPKRVNSILEIKGAGFDSMVMRLQFKMNIDKTLPLVAQIREAVNTGTADDRLPWIVQSQPGPRNVEMENLLPMISRYYEPAPMAQVLSRVCRDNNLFFDLNEQARQIKLIFANDITIASAPAGYFPPRFSFRGTALGGGLISTFTIRDYATAAFETEAFDAALFNQVDILDDSGASGLFDNIRPNLAPPPLPGAPKSYPFFVLEYALQFDSNKSTCSVLGTNNWLLSNFKLDTFFANAVYGDVTQ